MKKEDGWQASTGPISQIASGFEDPWTAYPQSLSKDYYEGIGEICARWSWLEFQLGVIARESLRIKKPEGFSVFGGMSMRSISTVLTALTLSVLPKGKPKLSAAISELSRKLQNIQDMRNEYAHAIWGYNKSDNPNLGIWKFKKPEDRASPNWVNRSLAKIRDDAKMLADLQVTAQEITHALKGRPSRFSD